MYGITYMELSTKIFGAFLYGTTAVEIPTIVVNGIMYKISILWNYGKHKNVVTTNTE